MILALMAATAATTDILGIPTTGLWSLTVPGALLGLVVIMVLGLIRGWVIPKNSHEREMALVKAHNGELLAINAEQVKTIRELNSQNSQLMEVGRITEAFFRATAPPDVDFGKTTPVREGE